MARYPDSFLEQLKNKIDIVDLISTYVNVQRKGRDYWACCPFHNEKTPSFQIRSDQQYYRCYGCGKYGNIFNFFAIALSNADFFACNLIFSNNYHIRDFFKLCRIGKNTATSCTGSIAACCSLRFPKRPTRPCVRTCTGF